MSHRNTKHLDNKRIVYRRNPITDVPTMSFAWGNFYEEGTYECYELFRSKAKITTYKSLKWHVLVLGYLNPNLNKEEFEKIIYFITDKENGFVTFFTPEKVIKDIINNVLLYDLEEPPKNKLRKIIFKDSSGLLVSEKMSIVGKLIGKTKKADSSDIYETMLYIHDDNERITIKKIANMLDVSTRTIYRNMDAKLNQEKELLNGL
jgi:transcriptional antiterminator